MCKPAIETVSVELLSSLLWKEETFHNWYSHNTTAYHAVEEYEKAMETLSSLLNCFTVADEVRHKLVDQVIDKQRNALAMLTRALQECGLELVAFHTAESVTYSLRKN